MAATGPYTPTLSRSDRTYLDVQETGDLPRRSVVDVRTRRHFTLAGKFAVKGHAR